MLILINFEKCIYNSAKKLDINLKNFNFLRFFFYLLLHKIIKKWVCHYIYLEILYKIVKMYLYKSEKDLL